MACMGGNGELFGIPVTCTQANRIRLFIIEGVVTIGVATVCIWLLPDEPLTTRWLSPEQRQLAHDRIQRDTVGLESSKGVKAGFMQALRDPRLYLLVFMQNMHLSATSFNQVSTVSPSRRNSADNDTSSFLPLCRRLGSILRSPLSSPHHLRLWPALSASASVSRLASSMIVHGTSPS
jgi:hypothetical protein